MATSKYSSAAKAVAVRKHWKSQRLKVVFTNGVFDILHAGHLDLLEKSKAMGDRLIVGVNSDASVRRLNKGPERPLNKLADRARLLSGLSCVDLVVAFSEDTPENLLSQLKPDILIKGADYRLDQVAGRQYTGRVALVRLKKGYSTTALVKRIRAHG